MKQKKCGGCQKDTCDGCRLMPEMKLHTDKENVQQIRLKAEGEESAVGIAYDIGTTTIAAALWDLETGECIGTISGRNLQCIWGNDVVSRIAYCVESEEHSRELQYMIVNAMDGMAAKMIRDYRVSGRVKRAVVAGNTAMCEILLGISLQGLAGAPFHKGYTGCVEKKGAELGFKKLKNITITVLPAIEGYVGADTLAVYTYVKSMGAREGSLIVDVGTNGEMVLIGKKQIYACSVAAGPALEGAAVSCGMTAFTGAVASVNMVGLFPGEDIACEVIGNENPEGICGSGLIDAFALLYRLGVIDKSGYMKNKEEAARDNVKAKICQRIDTVDKENRFCLAKAKETVYITGQDVRQLQLAKSAIRAGIEILLQKENMTIEDIDKLYLAGAFGNYIRPESAIEIGLLPDIAREKIVAVGNGAGFGAAMALLSEKIKNEMPVMSEQIEHIELAEEASFEELFMTYMELP